MKPVTITVDEDGKQKIYTLEFNKRVIRAAGEAGFVPNQIFDGNLMKIYDLFWYAFQMHHAGTTRQTTDAIIDSWGGLGKLPDGLLERLVQLWDNGFAIAEENRPKNLTATVEF